MSFQKKNVIQGFMKEEYVPTADQFLVKYCSGKGNNLHEVECVDGTTILVSMPKKYRHTVWLKKDDCLVIDPIEEGKKVKGEIVCVLPNETVRDLISTKQWPLKREQNADNQLPDTEALLRFFASVADRNKTNRNEVDNTYPPSESEEDEEDEDDDEEEEENEEEGAGDEENQGENEQEVDNDLKAKENGKESSSNPEANEDDDVAVNESIRDRNTSRVQLVTSGVVTVTNVISDRLDNDIQSLEFEAEEDSADDLAATNRDVHRHTNTIRIQVNYGNANGCSGASGD